jgi:hypothetical protein
MAPLPGSPAIDAGDRTASGLPGTDQRGFARISGAAVDIGACEVQQPSLNPAAVPDGTYGAAYASPPLPVTEAPGGAGGPYTFAVTAGALPPGLSLDGTSGALSGTPTKAAPFSFTVTATDGGGFTGSQGYTLTVSPAALTITAGSTTKPYGQALAFAGTEFTATGLVNGDTVSGVTLTSAGAAAGAGVAGSPYAIVASAAVGSGLGNYAVTYVSGALTVTPAALAAAAVNFGATAGAPFSGAVATFTTADHIDGAAAFTAVITWGDGSTSSGVITGGSGRFSVCGSHTYAAAASDAVTVQITNPNTQSATVSDTAAVTSLSQGVTKGLTGGIGFWHNTNGQALLNSFNGGSNSTALGTWLATTFANLYGAAAGSNSLAGQTNAQVAAYFQTLFALGGTQAQAQVLAVALNVYATTSSLGGTAGKAYGFTVSATGLGARSYSVGKDGAAFGVANNAPLTVYGLLAAVNTKAVQGVLYNGDATLQAQCADLLSALNDAGGI